MGRTELRVLDLEEERPFPVDLDADEVEQIYRGFRPDVEIQFRPGGPQPYLLVSHGTIGYLPVNPSLHLRIHPKAPISSIFAMLEQVYDLSSFRIRDGSAATVEREHGN